jgi:hypothetical protein
VRFILRVGVPAVIAAASAFLAATGPSDHEAWRITAACITALPGAFIAGAGLANRFRPSEAARSSVALLLRQAIADLIDETVGEEQPFRRVVSAMSFHVWLLPLWYRRLHGVRRKVAPIVERVVGERRLAKLPLRPKLQRFVVDSLADIEPSGVGFRKGVGLVGICLARDRRNKALIVDFETADMRALVACSDEEWKAAPVDWTHNLKHKDFNKLADKYGQAAAYVLRERRNGEPVGCLTFELPPDAALPIQDYNAPLASSGEPSLTPEGAALLRRVKSTRDMVQGLIAVERIGR